MYKNKVVPDISAALSGIRQEKSGLSGVTGKKKPARLSGKAHRIVRPDIWHPARKIMSGTTLGIEKMQLEDETKVSDIRVGLFLFCY